MARAATDARLVFVMAGSEEQAASIARAVVEERLAACVNIVGPVRSIYRWHGAIEDEREYLLIMKTRARLFAKLERRVRELHSYEVPEIIAVTIAAGAKTYLEWLNASTAPNARATAVR
ncbi:MAG: divalent-cation tolerance protein CutA [Candidatus Binataceae bacterium]